MKFKNPNALLPNLAMYLCVQDCSVFSAAAAVAAAAAPQQWVILANSSKTKKKIEIEKEIQEKQKNNIN